MKKWQIGGMIVLLGLLLSFSRGSGSGQGSTRVGLALQFGYGSVATQCLEFASPQVTGLDVLKQSGYAIDTLVLAGQGQAVCRIGKIGCPVSDCFCEFPAYWSYWHASSNGWTYSAQSADRYSVTDGSVEGWSWSKGEAPAQVSFDQICAAQNGASGQGSGVSDQASTTFSSQQAEGTSGGLPAPASKNEADNSQLFAKWAGAGVFMLVLLTLSVGLSIKFIVGRK